MHQEQLGGVHTEVLEEEEEEGWKEEDASVCLCAWVSQVALYFQSSMEISDKHTHAMLCREAKEWVGR